MDWNHTASLYFSTTVSLVDSCLHNPTKYLFGVVFWSVPDVWARKVFNTPNGTQPNNTPKHKDTPGPWV